MHIRATTRFLILLPLVVLFGCASGGRDEATAQHDAAIEELEEALATREQRVAALEAAKADSDAALETARAERDEAQQRILELTDTIDSLREQQAQPPEPTAELTALQQQLAAARAAQASAGRRLAESEANNASLADQLSSAREEFAQLDTRLLAMQGHATAMYEADASASTSRLAETVELQDLDSDAPIVKKVFYATNRVQLARSATDYLLPFLNVLIAVALTVFLLLAKRRYIKKARQRSVGLAIKTLGGLAIAVTGALALQEALLMRQSDQVLAIQYGNEIRDADSDGTPYERGWVEVSIPPDRDPGEMNRPSLIRLEFTVDPTEHFQLTNIRPVAKDRFYTDLESTIAGDPDRNAFVFVHGFHNTFEDAAFRTAQMAHDMGFPGAPVFFSWPSQGAVLDYLTDAANVETSVLHLKRFLLELHRETGATQIHLIAHSMGSRALAQAVEDLARTDMQAHAFGQLVFAAPDIKKDLLEQKIAALRRITSGVSLYASSHDAALLLSRALQGGNENNYQRAGETHPSPMVAPPMQTIDVSQATKGHSYVANSAAMLRDLAALLIENRVLDADASNYVPVDVDAGYWMLEAD